MAGPWEKYAVPAGADAPWTKYGGAAAPPPAADPGMSPLAPEPKQAFDPDVLGAMTGPQNEQKRRDYLQQTHPSTENVLAGIGQGMTSTTRGAGELIGDALRKTDWGKKLSTSLGLPTVADVDEAKKLDKPLLESKGGQRGAMIGNAAMALPIGAAMPELGIAGRLATSPVVGGAMGAAQPVGTGDSRAGNAARGAITSLATQAGGEVLGGIAGKAAPWLSQKLGNEVPQIPLSEKQVAQQAMMDKGYTMSPAETNPSTLNRLAEGLAGKAPTSQLAMAKNEANTTRLIKDEFKIPQDAPLDVAALKKIRAEEGKAYAELKNVKQALVPDKEFADVVKAAGGDMETINKSFPGLADNKAIKQLQGSMSAPEMTFESAVEAVKRLRRTASANLKGYDNPDKLELGRAQLQVANGVEDLMDRNLKALQMPDLLERYRNARVTIAKTHDVEEVLGDDGLISTKLLKKRMDNDVPLSGNLADIARAQGTQPRSLRNVKETGGATLSDPLSTMAGLSGQHPGASVGLPMVRHAAQQAILSPWYQRNFVRPGGNQSGDYSDLLRYLSSQAPQVPLQGQR